ncbi:MAG: hypothetical protein KJ063_00670 [Anaerolineae bacterium]|nr:hypothetical protein [Anaerolineae bacterium]
MSLHPRLFTFIMIGCGQFVLLTLLAMLFYAGGNAANPADTGYHFFRNFFSDLGLTVAHNGQANTVSFLMFTTALSGAGFSLILFFGLLPAFFQSDYIGWQLARVGSIAGLIAGLCFIGVAFTPADQYLETHTNFVFGAFGSYFVAVLFYLGSMIRVPAFAPVYRALLVGFALVLGWYVWLLFYGPRDLILQVTGQKIVAYSAIVTIFFLAYGARKKLEAAAVTSQ